MWIVYYYICKNKIEGEKNLLMIMLSNRNKDKQDLLMEIKLGIKKFKLTLEITNLCLISNQNR
jgi:hypothetical protein